MISKVFGEMFHLVISIVAVALAIVVIVNAGKWSYAQGYEVMDKTDAASKEVKNIEVVIPKGATTSMIADILKNSGAINSTIYFRIVSKLEGNDAKYQHGTYTLNTSMDEETMMEVLMTQGDKRETVRFTIPEGKTLKEAANILINAGLTTEKDFYDALDNTNFGYSFVGDVPDRKVAYQGYLFPDTYEVYKDASAVDIVSTMFSQFDKVFTDEYRARAKELGLTVDQVITIASIIEAEVRYDAPDKNERALVAGVIYNRLEIGMPLEMCSTVMYILGKDRSRLLYADLEIESPYNTYINAGLPEGPINSPGRAAIEAALYPEESDYLYFVLKDVETGEHSFNSSYSAHVNDKAKYGQDF